MRRSIRSFIFILLLLSLTFCDRGSKNNVYKEIATDKEAIIMPASTLPVTSEAGDKDTQIQERKLTKTGTISFRTSDMNKTKNDINRTVADLKGYISNETTSGYENRTENTLTIRVPSENFDNLLQKIESFSLKIDYKSFDVHDVTQEYFDLVTRINTKKEIEARYQELLKRANTVEDILKIEEQIGKIQTEIESAEGSMRYLSKQVDYSTLTVTYYVINRQFSFFDKISNAFKNGWSNLLWVLIGITNLWAIILLSLIIWLSVVYIKKEKRKKK